MFIIVYSSLVSRFKGIYAQIYNGDGSTNMTAFIVSNNGTSYEGSFDAI